MINKQVFRTIQSGKEKEWYAAVTNAALYMATGGFLKEANELLRALWKHNLDHDRTTWMADNAFEVLWYAAGERPEFVPFEKVKIDELEFDFRKYCTGADSFSIDDFIGFMPGLNLANVSPSEMILPDRSESPTFFAAIKNGKMPKSEMELQSLERIEKELNRESPIANYEFCDYSSLAAELAAKNNKTDVAIKFAKLWAGNYHERYLGYSFAKMATNRHVAPLLLKGILADELKLSQKKCSVFLQEAIIVINERMIKGDTLVYGKLTWTEIIKKLSILSIKNDPDLFNEKQKKEKWIGLPPATKKSITESEKRLGIKLPNDYKEFLLVSNGLPEFPIINPPIIPIDGIDLLKKRYVKIYGDDNIFTIIKDYYDEEEGTIAGYVDKAIAISKLPAEQEIWLIPPMKKNKGWETWYFASWRPGEERFKSFREFIESGIQRLEED